MNADKVINQQNKKGYKLTVLSIDGGGIRGLVPALILAEIEKRTEKQIHELFDLIAGTSTGGILSLGLVNPDILRRTQSNRDEEDNEPSNRDEEDNEPSNRDEEDNKPSSADTLAGLYKDVEKSSKIFNRKKITLYY